MVKNLRPLSDKLTSVDWLNAIRNTLGSEYQSRVPEATQANITETINQIWDYAPNRNQVIDALVNRIGTVIVRNTSWTNPLAEFKMGMLTQGDTIEEVMNGLLTAIDYDFDRDELEKEIFGNHPFETQSRFHKINRRDRYVFTINQVGLRMALLNNELPSFLNTALSMPYTSDQNDEFLLMMNLFKEFDQAADGKLHTVHVDDVADEGSDQAASRFMLRRLREYSNTLPFISRLYNPAGMPVATTPDKLMLIVTAGADAAMDVEALAGAFNIGKAEFGSRKVVVPDRYFGIEGTQAILTTRDFFVVADSLIETTSMFNPAKLTTNYWYHHHQVMSASPFAPFVLFNSERPSTIISETEYSTTDIGAFTFTDSAGTVEATSLKRGVLYDVRVEGVTTPAGGVAALDLDIEGATSAFTYVTNNGGLFVAPNEEAVTLTIRATAIDGSGYTETTTRTVRGDLIIPWPSPQVIPDSDNDALEEVTPVKPDFENNVITIPSERGVQYKEGATNLTNGAKLTVVNGTPRTITAEARSGFELATGATASWVFTYVAP